MYRSGHGDSPRSSPDRHRSSDRDGARARRREREAARGDADAQGHDLREALGAACGAGRRAARARAGRSRDRRHAAGGCQRRCACGEAGWQAAQEGAPQHRRAAQTPAALRAGAGAGHDGVPVLPGPASQDRRGRQRGAGRDPGDPAGAAHDPSQICLPRLHRRRGAGEGAAAPDRERHGLDGARDPRGGLEVRLVSAAVPAGADFGRPGRPSRPGDACRLGEACGLVAQEPL